MERLIMSNLNSIAANALKYYEDEECTLAGLLHDDDEEIYHEIGKFLMPNSADYTRIKITHSDNSKDFEAFTDFYTKLRQLQPVKTIDNFCMYDVDGIRYAADYAEGGAYGVYYVQ